MKKVVIFFFVVICSFSIFGCKKQTTGQTTTGVSTQTNFKTTTTKTTVVQTTTEKPFYTPEYCEVIDIDYDWINDKVNSMTYEELAGQMLMAEYNSVYYDQGSITNYNLGAILNGGGVEPKDGNRLMTWLTDYRLLQGKALQSSSKIPLMWGTDAVHGNNNVAGATIFPHNIGLGAANDPDLMYRIGVVTAREVKAAGQNWNFSPSVGMAQNIKWGRTFESFSENVEIQLNLVEDYVKGLQSYCVAATAKHYLADGATDGGKDQGNVSKTNQEVLDYDLLPYIEAVDAGVDTIMASYSSLRGIKMHENDIYLTDILKGELGFTGFIVGDYDGVKQISGDTYYDKVVKAVNAGVDMLMEPFTWKEAIEAIVTGLENGDITIERVKDAVSRILRVKYKIGLFDDPYRLIGAKYFGSEENIAVAREAVRKSIVLLKNDNNALPVNKNANIAFVGPVDNIGLQCGGWTITWTGAMGDYNTQDDNRRINNYVKGNTIYESFSKLIKDNGGTVSSEYKDADVVFVLLSENPYAEYYGDNQSLSLTASSVYEGFGVRNTGTANLENVASLEIAKKAKEEGKTVIGLLYSGRPLILKDYLAYFDGFIACFLPGSEAGNGIADVVFGDFDFTGKLSFTWPKSANDVENISFLPTYDREKALFPYGFGLNYGTNNDN